MNSKEDDATKNAVVHIDAAIKDLVPPFIEHVKKDADKIQLLLSQNDFEAASEIGHKWAGNGAGYGLKVISESGKFIEEAARAGKKEEVLSKTNELAAYLNNVQIIYR